MPGINVSALSGGDLRRLLRVAHARHDGLLADRLEWEIAERATSGGRPAGPFATLPDDDDLDDGVERMAVPDDEPEAFAPEVTAPEPARAGRSVLLVTLGAIAGALLSASVFWGLGRMDGLPVLGRAQPTPTVAMVSTPPLAQTVAVLTPEPLPLQADPIAPPVEAPLPAATAAVAVAPKAEPAVKALKTPAPTKRATRKTRTATQLAERAARPPTLNEWLAKSEPEEPIH